MSKKHVKYTRLAKIMRHIFVFYILQVPEPVTQWPAKYEPEIFFPIT